MIWDFFVSSIQWLYTTLDAPQTASKTLDKFPLAFAIMLVLILVLVRNWRVCRTKGQALSFKTLVLTHVNIEFVVIVVLMVFNYAVCYAIGSKSNSAVFLLTMDFFLVAGSIRFMRQ